MGISIDVEAEENRQALRHPLLSGPHQRWLLKTGIKTIFHKNKSPGFAAEDDFDEFGNRGERHPSGPGSKG